MNLTLDCEEWINTNKTARLIKTAKNSKKKKNQDLSNTEYLLQIAPSKSSQSKLACLTSNQSIHIFDQNSLRSILKFKDSEKCPKTITEIGFYSKSDDLIFNCSDNGSLKCWDLRQNQSSEDLNECICFKTEEQREFLSADINLADNYFIVGTNKNIDDALVYIFDIRMNEKFLHKLTESHSNDINQVKFYPNAELKFSTASLDGLVCLYDLNQPPVNIVKSPVDKKEDENETDSDEDPDFMEQVFNADSSVQKIGYLSSKCSEVDQIYAITYTNDLYVWDLLSHDIVHQYKNSSLDTFRSSNQEEDYIFDCFYMEPNCMVICKGDTNGTLRLFNDNKILYDSRSKNDSPAIPTNRTHRDVIRSSYWNGVNLYTAGEDGFLFKWKLIDKNSIDSDQINRLNSNKRDIDDDEDDDDSEDETSNKRPNKKNLNKKSK